MLQAHAQGLVEHALQRERAPQPREPGRQLGVEHGRGTGAEVQGKAGQVGAGGVHRLDHRPVGDQLGNGLQRRSPGLRPVGFWSPYEAAAWAVLSQRIRVTQAAKLRAEIVDRHGDDGAFPSPQRLLGLDLDLPGRKGEYLGTFEDAISAAHKRYMYYKQNNMPYGEMEIAVDELRRNGEKGTDDELRAIVLETAKHMGITHMYESEEEAAPPKRSTKPGAAMSGFGDNAAFEAAQRKLKERDDAEERAGDKLYLRPAPKS